MGRLHARLDVLKAAALAAALACSACSSDLGPGGPWTAWDQIDGPLRPELSAPPAAAAPADRLRVVTFNVHFAEDVEGFARAFRDDPELAAADLVLMQEMRAYRSEGATRAARLASALGMGHVWAPAREVDGGTHGLAMMSRFRLENVAVMELPHAELAYHTERRIALAADVQVGGRAVRVVNLHLDTRLDPTERILQLRPAVIDAPSPVLVAGDFNSNPFVWLGRGVPVVPAQPVADTDQSVVLDDYFQALGFLTPTAGFGATYDTGLTDLRLDSIYARGLSCGAGGVARNVRVSDHFPVWLDVTGAP